MDNWPTLPNRGNAESGGGVPLPSSTASTAATDITTSSIVQPGGPGKHTSLSQSDRLKRYVESGRELTGGYKVGAEGSVFGGSSVMGGVNLGRRDLDDDVRSVSTAFASQVGISGYD